MVVCAQTSARVLVGRGAQRCPRPCQTRRTRRILDRHSSAGRADKLARSKCTHAHPGAAGHIPCAATASTPAARLPTPLTLGGVDSATTARPTGHVHTCQNDPTTCPSHHMSHLPCTGSHTGPRELRVGGWQRAIGRRVRRGNWRSRPETRAHTRAVPAARVTGA